MIVPVLLTDRLSDWCSLYRKDISHRTEYAKLITATWWVLAARSGHPPRSFVVARSWRDIATRHLNKERRRR